MSVRTRIEKLIRSLSSAEITVLREGIGGFVVKSAGAGLSFILQIALARTLGGESFGKYTYVLSWANIVVLFSNLGFNTASVRFVAEYESRKDWDRLRRYLTFSRRTVLAVSIIASLIFAALAVSLVSSNRQELLYTFLAGALAVPIVARIQIAEAELRGLKKVIRSKIPRSIGAPVIFIGSMAILAWGYGINIYATQALGIKILVSIGALGALLAFSREAIPRHVDLGREGTVLPGWKWKWMSVARDMLLVSGFSLVIFRADIIMVGALIRPEDSGMYKVASKVASLLVFVLSAVNAILSPIASDLYFDDKEGELQNIVSVAALVSFISSVILSLLIYTFQNPIISLFGSEFLYSKKALWPLIIGQLANSFAGPSILLLNMTGRQRLTAKILGASAVLNIVLNVIMIETVGFEGAALATMTTMILWNVLAVISVRYSLNMKPTAISGL